MANVEKKPVWVRIWRKGNPSIPLVGLLIGMAAMESTVGVPQML